MPYRPATPVPPRGAASGSEKREAIPCDNHPDKVGTPAAGRQLRKSQKAQSVPEGGPKSALAPIRRPPSARRATAPQRATHFSLWTVHGPFLFGKTERGPPRPARWGGGARERAQFSPQAETELSGLCDDDNGGASPWKRPPAGAKIPVAAVRRLKSSPGG